jgi:hypothetical protein
MQSKGSHRHPSLQLSKTLAELLKEKCRTCSRPPTKSAHRFTEDWLFRGTSMKAGISRCRHCHSTNCSMFQGEVALHFQGLKGLKKPIVWVFPEFSFASTAGTQSCRFRSGKSRFCEREFRPMTRWSRRPRRVNGETAGEAVLPTRIPLPHKVDRSGRLAPPADLTMQPLAPACMLVR